MKNAYSTNNAFTNRNVAVGYEALRGSATSLSNTGNDNTAIGYQTLMNNSSGSRNTAISASALASNSTGNNNTAGGYTSLYSNTIGISNTANGAYTLYTNLNGNYNTATGGNALYSNSSGDNNTASGYAALFTNDNGDDNTANGYYALHLNTGNLNTAVGFSALAINSTGIQNTALGANSLVTNTTGSYHTAVGYNTGPNAANLANTNCFGIDATGTATDQVSIGNTFVTSIRGQVSFTTYSDARFKEQVQENVAGLLFINQLRPVTYRVNRDKMINYMGIKPSYRGESMSEVTTGFIAQEVEAAAKKAGFTFSGVDAPKNENDYYGLRYAEFVVPLVKAVQELAKQNEELKKRVEELEKQ
jgi:hypothetical protein